MLLPASMFRPSTSPAYSMADSPLAASEAEARRAMRWGICQSPDLLARD